MTRTALIALLLALMGANVRAQSPGGIDRFAIEGSGLASRGPVRPWAWVGDAGRRAAVLGTESGRLDIWVWPLRLVRDFRLEFRFPDSPFPIRGDLLAGDVIVRPEGITIVYTHPAFTVRQHIFASLHEPGVIALLDVDAVRPIEISAYMNADFNQLTPETFGGGSIEWDDARNRLHLVQGGVRWYHALIGSPVAASGSAQSAHELTPTTRLVFQYDRRATGQYIPIIFAGGSQVRDSVDALYGRLLARVPALWREKTAHYRSVANQGPRLGTPDDKLNQAFEWSKAGLDQLQSCTAVLGCGMTAAFGPAQPRNYLPGSAWSSRDAVFTVRALSSLGHFDLVRAGLRPPSAQTWPAPYWLLACAEYWKASGDDAFIRAQWPEVLRALASAAVPANDIYTAGVWAAALEGLQEMARGLGEPGIAAEAGQRLERAQAALESGYWLADAGVYAAVLQPGALRSDALTAWPAIAMSFALLDDTRADRMLREISSSAISADWGVRSLSRYHPLYDPLERGNGAVSAFATGVTALGQYRYHRGWAGHDLLRTLAGSSFDYARGRMADLLSGAFYAATDTGSAQHASSAGMFVTAMLRGLIGIEVDAPNRALLLEPHMPAEWNSLEVGNIVIGSQRVTVSMRRGRGKYEISLQRSGGGAPLFVRLAPALPLGARVLDARVDDRDVLTHAEESVHDLHAVVEFNLQASAEVEISYEGGLEVAAPTEAARIGDASTGLKVLDFRRDGQDYVLLVEGQPNRSYALELRAESRVRGAIGAEIAQQSNQMIQLRISLGPSSTPTLRREVRLRA